jgi:hypothetical protein
MSIAQPLLVNVLKSFQPRDAYIEIKFSVSLEKMK